ncbi:MAG TPA: hypothetical protein VLS89_01585 [Candidatus Nanopelagicales bacterium]|nr:hypothetical protein [Candidatus Nanopelagicales bacterium]
MTRYGYGYVTDKGFLAFTHDLTEGAWAHVDPAAFDNPERMLPADPLQVPRDIEWKLRATWTIAALRDVLGASTEVLAGLDTRWDSTQRKLYFILGGAAEDVNPAIRDAARRCQGALLEKGGTAQINFSYDGEVDFGRNQIALMTDGPLVADVSLLNLQALCDEIRQTTEALAEGIGRRPGEKRTGARSIRIRAACAACAAAFNGIHQEIASLIARTPPGAGRSRLEALLAPFEALLSRYPSTASAAADAPDDADAPPPASPETPVAG